MSYPNPSMTKPTQTRGKESPTEVVLVGQHPRVESGWRAGRERWRVDLQDQMENTGSSVGIKIIIMIIIMSSYRGLMMIKQANEYKNTRNSVLLSVDTSYLF